MEPGMLLVVLVVGFFLYFIPVWVAMLRDVEKKTAIVMLNIFLGATAVGWCAALFLAFTRETYTERLETERRIAARVAAMQSGAPEPEAEQRSILGPVVAMVVVLSILGSALAVAINTAPGSNQPSATTPNPAAVAKPQRT